MKPLRTRADLIRAGRPARHAFYEGMEELRGFAVRPSEHSDTWRVVSIGDHVEHAVAYCPDQARAEIVCEALNIAALALRDARARRAA